MSSNSELHRQRNNNNWLVLLPIMYHQIRGVSTTEAYISRWILEFLLRKPIEERFINPLLNILPILNEDHSLTRMVLLKRLSSQVSNASISEKTLDYLEMIEQYYYEHEIPVLDSLREAYCAVAVHCTVIHLKPNSDDCRNYFEAVIRIWRARIRDMKKERCEKVVGLVSDRLINLSGEMEEAIWRVSVRDHFLTRDTQSDALKSLRLFLAEALAEMGPPFLEGLAANALMMMQAIKQVGVSSNPPLLLADQSGGRQACSADPSPEGADLNHENRLERCGTNTVEEAATKQSKGKEVKVSRSTLLAADRAGEQKACSADAAPQDTTFSCRNHLAHQTSHMAVDSTKEVSRAAPNAYNVVSTPDVRKVQEALKSSALDLQTMVRDPLPDALHVAANISSNIAREETTDSVENHINICVPSVDEVIEVVHAKETNTRNKSTVSRRSLKDKDSTACTFESLSEGSPCRPHLRTPKRKVLSPLNKYRIKKATKRRKKFWTPEEEQALRDAIEECGAGNWKIILNKYGDAFDDRTNCDLRDKWRNMIK